MKLTILDGMAVNPGDLSWDAFKKVASPLVIYQNTCPEDTIKHIADSKAVLLNKVVIDKEVLDACPKLSYIGVLATGYNVVDIAEARKKGVCVTNIPSYSTMEVAQHTIALLLTVTNHIAEYNNSVHSGDWIKSKSFCYYRSPLISLQGKTLGILGYGNIGKKVASIARTLGLNLLICPHHYDKEIEGCCTFDDLLKASDFISLHAPLTKETYHIIDDKALSKVKRGAVLINTARGQLVLEEEIKKALDNGRLSYYLTDVLEEEPMKKECVLYGCDRCIITPHIAWGAKETRERLQKIAFNNLSSYLDGRPMNRVN